MNIILLFDVECNGDNTGHVEVAGVDGNYGYTYNWSNGVTGPVNTSLFAGTYTVSITDAFSCMVVNDIVIDEPEPLFTIAVETDDACGNGTGSVLFVPFGGVGPYMYDIGNGPESNYSFDNLAAGIYPYTQYDVYGCTYSDQFEIEVVGIPIASAAAMDELDCTTNQVTVSGSGSSSGSEFSYLWTTTNGNILSDPTLLNIQVDEPGDYTLEVTNTTHNCVTSAAAAVMETSVPPTASASSPSDLDCNIPSVTLDGSGSSSGPDYTYLWTTTDGNIVSDETTLAPLVDAAGTYQLEVTNTSNGCMSSTSVAVAGDFTAPSITASGAEITCSETSVEICATVDPGVTVTWDTPSGPVDALCITVDAADTYTATATAANGCTQDADAVVTQSADIPQTSIADPATVTCTVPNIVLTGTLNGDPAEHTILWTTTNGNIVSGENTLTPTVDAGGSYTMKVTHIASGCVSNTTTDVPEDTALPVAAYTFAQNIGLIQLTNGSSNADGEVTWDLGNGETASGDFVEVTYDETGIYTVCLTATNDCGTHTDCQDIQFISVMTQNTTIGNITCFGDNNGSITVDPDGGLPPYTITWQGPNGFTSSDLTITNLLPGDYTMTLTDDGGNTATETYAVAEPAALMLQSSVTGVSCFGGTDGSATITITGGTPGYSLSWPNGLDPAQLPAGEYTVSATDANGCATQHTFTVNQPAKLVSTDTEVTDAVGGNADGSITIAPAGGVGNIEVVWDNGMTGASITGLVAGFYTATLTDDNGCVVVLDPIEVKSVSNTDDIDVITSFAFGPNPATLNVNLELEMTKARDVFVTIRNGVGQVVYTRLYPDTSSISDQIDVETFSAGMHILAVTTSTTTLTKKFIVVK